MSNQIKLNPCRLCNEIPYILPDGVAIRGCINSGFDCQNDRYKLFPSQFEDWNKVNAGEKSEGKGD